MVAPWLANGDIVNFIKSKKLYRIPGNDLLKILTNPNLNCATAATLDFLKKWIKFQSDEEKKLLSEMLDAIKVKEELKGWILNALMKTDKTEFESSTAHDEYEKNDLYQVLLSDLKVDESE